MKRVFVSYSQDSDEHKQRVHALADRLQAAGVTVIIDRDCGPGGPSEGWEKWSEKQAEFSEVVLVVFTESYRRCWNGDQPPGMRLGGTLEAKVLNRRIYEAGQTVDFCRVVVFDGADMVHIPKLIAGLRVFDASRDYTDLLEWLRIAGAAPALVVQPSLSISWPEPVAGYACQLADRVNEFRLFENVITGRDARRIVVLRGPSSSGKTALVTELFKLAKRLGLDHSQLDLKGCPSLNELLDSLALDISPSVLPAFHSASGTARKSALLGNLQKLRRPLVLGFDSFQEASADVTDWIEGQFLGRVERCSGLVVVLSGQKVPDSSRYSWGELTASVDLPPIKEVQEWQDYACRVLGRRGLARAHVEMLVHIFHGDPGQTSAVLRTFAPISGSSA